ncbi:hypothetical protein J7337_013911 [Fusarium musae]|uniref:Uncharacterized protein n=1 Tax=Fusarium musae TaxID=1042133 RepID=A0A9P8D3T6_9HYPO|nr:hypothetical protein J7337_013911 [Fusarium musae]KAG9494772.1 hypothetical protein J7337_013911 [Fusarium musae]
MSLPDLTAYPYKSFLPLQWILDQIVLSVQQLYEETNWSEALGSCEEHFNGLLPENFVGLFVSLLIIVLVGRFVVATVKGMIELLVSLAKMCLIAYILAIVFYLVNKMVD